MNYIRVNLLKKSEQRFQGAVSRRFMCVCIVITPILFVMLISGVALVRYSGVQSELRSSSQIWSSLKPRVELYKNEQRGLDANLQALKLLDGWKDTRVFHSELLSEIQAVVPENIQFKRLSILSEPKAIVFFEPEELASDYKLVIQGSARGDRAEDSVIGLRKNLMEPELMKNIFESVKLSSMRKQVTKDGENTLNFEFDGASKKGEVQ